MSLGVSLVVGVMDCMMLGVLLVVSRCGMVVLIFLVLGFWMMMLMFGFVFLNGVMRLF